jgi:hypothetical protein
MDFVELPLASRPAEKKPKRKLRKVLIKPSKKRQIIIQKA